MKFARPGMTIVLVSMPLLASAQAQDKEGIAGTWRGESACVQKDSACRDEIVVYHFAAIDGQPGYFSVNAEKIVAGRAVNMGALQFHQDQDQHVLLCKYSQGVWRLRVDGARIDGTLTRSDGAAFRRLALRKDS